MRIVEKKVEEDNAYETRLEEDLTVDEALILVAACAAKEKPAGFKTGYNYYQPAERS